MGAKLQHSDDDLAEVHEINVTPFIDVILVLLIIFMVAAPLATVDIAVNLPSANVEQKPRPDRPVFLTIKQDLTLSLGEQTVDRAALAGAIGVAVGGNKDQPIFLRADKAVPYGDVMEVMNLLRAGGFLKVALVALEKVP